MKIIADLHIHSKYSRATSREMDVPNIVRWAKYKGIGLMATGDFTHPLWLQELKRYLKPVGYGFYEYAGVNFFLNVEVCNIYNKNGRTRRIHNLIFAPGFDVVDRINLKFSRYGNLFSDGRPILSLDSEDLVKIVLDISEDCMIIPAHAWTPHFSVFGSNSGFNSLEECFGEERRNVHSIETGLSSDPKMNWRLSGLDEITLISNSDAHSPGNLGREVNVFNIDSSLVKTDLYREVMRIIKTKDKNKFLYTVEFFPEEGKYHFDGHRVCNVGLHPKESISNKDFCKKCGRKLTIGVLHRIEELADRDEDFIPENSIGYKNIIPLAEIIAEALNLGRGTISVEREYLDMVNRIGPEFDIMINISEQELLRKIQPKIAEGIIKTRRGEVRIEPGYDGVYGKISIDWAEKETDRVQEQLVLL